MFSSTSLCCALILAAPPAVTSKFEQVAPVPPEAETVARSKEQARAVVLIHGYRVYAKADDVSRAGFRDWQLPGSKLVRSLAPTADVFSYGYGQNASIDDIVASGGLADGVRLLRKAGYKEIILVGHSAGALIARQFVEDNPDAGVTKVVQVCPPNGGAKAAEISLFKSQRAFLDSLTPEGRQECLKGRAGKTIPGGVQFVCILSNAAGDSDGLVRCDCQWTADLQMQCVPVVPIKVEHRQAPRNETGIEAITAAVRRDQPRWKPEHVREVKSELFGQ
jgi:triacylglycerol esterase/lipase EstA (alpha/beta hydrolase family)